MNKRDYEAIAAILADEMEANRNEDRGASATISIARELADYFASTNPRFDRDRFLTAAGAW